MGARRKTTRTSNNDVTKWFDGFGITLYREDTFEQDKNVLYRTMKKIENGKIRLGLPLDTIKKIQNNPTVIIMCQVMKSGNVIYMGIV